MRFILSLLRFFHISDSGPRFVPTAQVLLSEEYAYMEKHIQTEIYWHSSTQWNVFRSLNLGMLNGNQSISVASTLLNHTIQSSALNIESNKASSRLVGN